MRRFDENWCESDSEDLLDKSLPVNLEFQGRGLLSFQSSCTTITLIFKFEPTGSNVLVRQTIKLHRGLRPELASNVGLMLLRGLQNSVDTSIQNNHNTPRNDMRIIVENS